METGARARGLAGWARGRALGNAVSGCWGRGSRDGAAEGQSEVKGAQLKLTATNSAATATRASARCAILIGSTAIRNLRIPLKPHGMFFSNRSKIAYLRARFAHISLTTNRRSHRTTHAGKRAAATVVKASSGNVQPGVAVPRKLSQSRNRGNWVAWKDGPQGAKIVGLTLACGCEASARGLAASEKSCAQLIFRDVHAFHGGDG
jgi:hypothetical protein